MGELNKLPTMNSVAPVLSSDGAVCPLGVERELVVSNVGKTECRIYCCPDGCEKLNQYGRCPLDEPTVEERHEMRCRRIEKEFVEMVGERYSDVDFDIFDFKRYERNGVNPFRDQAREYLKNSSLNIERGKGILLTGEKGRGKTMFMVALAKQFIKRGYSVNYITETIMFQELLSRDEAGQKIFIDEMLKYNIVIIDDIGHQRSSEFTRKKYLYIIDNCYRHKKVLWIASQYTNDSGKVEAKSLLENKIGDSAWSRLIEMSAPFALQLVAKDGRLENIKDRKTEATGEAE